MTDRAPTLNGITLGPNSPVAATERPTRVHRHVEAPIQRSVALLYSGCGMSVWQNSVYGVKPHGVTPGIPDMRVKRPDWRLDFDHETKAPGKRQTREQDRYLAECRAVGTVYVLGAVAEAVAFLAFLGLGTPVGDTIQFLPREAWASYMDWWRHRPALLAESWYASDAFAAALDRYGYRPPR